LQMPLKLEHCGMKKVLLNTLFVLSGKNLCILKESITETPIKLSIILKGCTRKKIFFDEYFLAKNKKCVLWKCQKKNVKNQKKLTSHYITVWNPKAK
jgi:hypothetical protein